MASFPVGAGETVVLRATNGRFLRMDDRGTLRADRWFPTEGECFELVRMKDERVALKTQSQRWLVRGPGGRVVASQDSTDPSQGEAFELIRLEQNRVALKRVGAAGYLHFVDTADRPIELGPQQQVPASAAIEIYQFSETPEAMRVGLSVSLAALAMTQLKDQVYDEVRSRLKVEYIELPAPTLRDWKRKKKHRVFAVREEQRVRAELDGEPIIEITHMPCLKGYVDGGEAALMFAVEAAVPVRGRVSFRVPEAWSASTGYRATAVLTIVGELRTQTSSDKFSLRQPELLEARVQIQGLDISNDLLNAGRGPIEDLINHEIRKNRQRIIVQANKTIREAVGEDVFALPLLQQLQ
jgi:hypothetical protein